MPYESQQSRYILLINILLLYKLLNTQRIPQRAYLLQRFKFHQPKLFKIIKPIHQRTIYHIHKHQILLTLLPPVVHIPMPVIKQMYIKPPFPRNPLRATQHRPRYQLYMQPRALHRAPQYIIKHRLFHRPTEIFKNFLKNISIYSKLVFYAKKPFYCMSSCFSSS